MKLWDWFKQRNKIVQVLLVVFALYVGSAVIVGVYDSLTMSDEGKETPIAKENAEKEAEKLARAEEKAALEKEEQEKLEKEKAEKLKQEKFEQEEKKKLEAEQAKLEKEAKEKEAKEKEERARIEKEKQEEEERKKVEAAAKAKEKEEQEKLEARVAEEKLTIDTSMYQYAENIEVTDALEINDHITLIIDMPKSNTQGIAFQHILNQSYDFLEQDSAKKAKTIGVNIRQDGNKIAMFTIYPEKFVENDDEPMAQLVLDASMVEMTLPEVDQYAEIMDLRMIKE